MKKWLIAAALAVSSLFVSGQDNLYLKETLAKDPVVNHYSPRDAIVSITTNIGWTVARMAGDALKDEGKVTGNVTMMKWGHTVNAASYAILGSKLWLQRDFDERQR